MSGKIANLLFDSGKPVNYAWFFMVLGIAAIAGMVGACCGAKSVKHSLCTSGEAADTHTAKKGADQ